MNARLGAVAATCLLLAACGGASSTKSVGGNLPASPRSHLTPPAASSPAGDSPAVAACFAKNKPDQPDILVREKDPTLPYVAQQLGGGYAYNHALNQCQTSVAFTLATVADKPGYCVQIAMAASNPGYNVEAKPAPPLKKIIASKGAC
jgi:hypothetical protein